MTKNTFLPLALVVILAGCGPSRPLTPEEKAEDERQSAEFNDKIDVQILAEKAVKLCLKWPHDASFGWCPTVDLSSDRSSAMVRGTVKAKNTFGATLTHEYGVHLVRDSDTWIVDRVVIGDETMYRRSTPEPFRKSRHKPSRLTKFLQKALEASEQKPKEKPAPTAKAKELLEPADVQKGVADEQAERTKASEEVRTRTWTSADGNFSIEARYLWVIGDKVGLKKTDGKTIEVPLDKLSEKDRRWVKQWNER